METRIKIVCYNQVEYWGKRENAQKFYENAMFATEGSERDRYMNIVRDLRNGWLLCTDGFSSPDTTKVLSIDTPDGTRDYGGKIHYPTTKKNPHILLDKESVAKILGVDGNNISESDVTDKYKQGKKFLFFYNGAPIEIIHIPNWKRMWVLGHSGSEENAFNEVRRKLEDSMSLKLNAECFSNGFTNEYTLL